MGYGPDYGSPDSGLYINKTDFIRYWDEEASSPHLFDGSTFISYEDEESMALKVSYAEETLGQAITKLGIPAVTGLGTLTGFPGTELRQGLRPGVAR